MNPLLTVRGAIATGFVAATLLSLPIGPTANFVMSVPMLLCMGSATHGLPV